MIISSFLVGINLPAIDGDGCTGARSIQSAAPTDSRRIVAGNRGYYTTVIEGNLCSMAITSTQDALKLVGFRSAYKHGTPGETQTVAGRRDCRITTTYDGML